MLNKYTFTSKELDELTKLAEDIKDMASHIRYEVGNYCYNRDSKIINKYIEKDFEEYFKQYLNGRIDYANRCMHRLSEMLKEIQGDMN